MDNNFYNSFLDASERAISQRSGPAQFKLHASSAHGDVGDGTRLHTVLRRSLANLDEELSRFEKHFSGKNNTVYWAADYGDVFDSLRRIFKTHKVKTVRLPNINASTIFRELGIKYFLRDERVNLQEDADMQFFVADLLLADTGSLLLLNQTNGILSRLNNDKTNVFFTTIDRVMANSAYVEAYQQLATYRSAGEQQDYVVFHGSPNCNSYLFIIDNQRTALLHSTDLRDVLACIQCGRCSDVCPVLQTIGEEPYNNVFSGPVANIILPYLETIDSYMHVAYACTLCGRCEEVCPISLPVRDMIIASRRLFLDEGLVEKKDRRALAAMRRFLTSRSKMNASAFHKRHLLCRFLSSDLKHSRRLPSFNKSTFNKLYQNSTHSNVQ